MYRLIPIVFYIATFNSVYCLIKTDLTCIQAFKNELNNDFLLGEWFKVYKWSYELNLPASDTCSRIVFSRLKAEQIQEYTVYYSDYSNYNITQNPMKTEGNGYPEGVIVGSNEVKFNLLPPNQHSMFAHGYMTQGYRKVTNQYVLQVDCDSGMREMWLLSRKRNPTSMELNDIIAGIPEVKHLETQRFCA